MVDAHDEPEPFELEDDLELEDAGPDLVGWSMGDAEELDAELDRVVVESAQVGELVAGKVRRPNPTTALLMLSVVTLVCVGTLGLVVVLPAFSWAVIDGWSPSVEVLNGLESLALLGVGALAAATGTKS